ncbi:MAG TPA: sigma-70 family RNA polymerase sigma factor [Gemmatimonadaceae bacterium]|jgi:RNA polymerase sigma-70 factor (ECF subfamily)|nr:sigma-70 family RNA polymerase sigma factor [Gemmatimonadaceae bacterium]
MGAGDERVFEDVVRAYGPGLCAFAERFVGAALAEELVQDVFCAIWVRREQLIVRDTVRSYLYCAVRNRAYNVKRSARVTAHWVEREQLAAASARETDVASPLEHGVDRGTLAAAIEREIANLPSRCREAFVLVRQHGLTYAEAAQVMGISIKTVDVQLGRAMRALRAGLAGVWP